MSKDGGRDSEQVFQVSKEYLKPFGNRVRWYEKLNLETKSNRGHNSVKIFDTVTSSCQKVGVVIVNKYLKFQKNILIRLGIK